MLQFLWISKKRVSVVVLSSTYHYHHLSSVPFCCTAVNNLPMGYPVLQQPPLPATHINSMSCSMSSSRVVKGIPASGNFHPIHMNAANEWEFLLISISSWLSFLFFFFVHILFEHFLSPTKHAYVTLNVAYTFVWPVPIRVLCPNMLALQKEQCNKK